MGTARIEFCEELTAQQKIIEREHKGGNLSQEIEDRVLNFHDAGPPNDQKNNHQDGRASSKCADQKTGGQNGRIPKWPATQATVKKGGHGVNADRPTHG